MVWWSSSTNSTSVLFLGTKYRHLYSRGQFQYPSNWIFVQWMNIQSFHAVINIDKLITSFSLFWKNLKTFFRRGRELSKIGPRRVSLKSDTGYHSWISAWLNVLYTEKKSLSRHDVRIPFEPNSITALFRKSSLPPSLGDSAFIFKPENRFCVKLDSLPLSGFPASLLEFLVRDDSIRHSYQAYTYTYIDSNHHIRAGQSLDACSDSHFLRISYFYYFGARNATICWLEHHHRQRTGYHDAPYDTNFATRKVTTDFVQFICIFPCQNKKTWSILPGLNGLSLRHTGFEYYKAIFITYAASKWWNSHPLSLVVLKLWRSEEMNSTKNSKTHFALFYLTPKYIRKNEWWIWYLRENTLQPKIWKTSKDPDTKQVCIDIMELPKTLPSDSARWHFSIITIYPNVNLCFNMDHIGNDFKTLYFLQFYPPTCELMKYI